MSHELLVEELMNHVKDREFLKLLKEHGYVIFTLEEYEETVADAWSEGLLEGIDTWANDNDNYEEWLWNY